MNFNYILFILLQMSSIVTFAQEKEKEDQYYPQNREDKVTIFKPTVGFGIGILSYYGDIGSASFKNPMTSRLGYQFLASTRLNSSMDLNFHTLFGKIEANERSVGRNLNFQSEIRTGGLSISYNFHQILPKQRKLDPFVSIGIESVEFLSKTDLYDSNGNKYHYWSDGSIRNISESHPDGESAIHLQRDYIFETDIRESNEDGFGKYSERTFSIPAGVGLRMYLNDNLDFKIGTTFHYTFSNLIDGITENSVGPRAGNSQNDHFLYSSVSLNYRFTVTKKVRKKDIEKMYSDVDYTSIDMEDIDSDGVKDFSDDCPETPSGVKVNEKGCPLDSDSDGVPDYLDLEPNTPVNAFVDKDGVQLSDEAILLLYETYMDSTGKFATITRTQYAAEVKKPKTDQYKVQLGSYTQGVPPELINKYLSLKDVTSTEVNNSVTVYTAGDYSNYNAALKRKNELVASGIDDATVVLVRNGKYIEESDPRFSSLVNTTSATDSNGKSEDESEVAENLINETNKGTDTSENVKSETNTNSNNTEDNTEDNTEESSENSITNKESTINSETGSGTKTNINSESTNSGKVSDSGITEFTSSSLSEKDPNNIVVFRIQLGAYSRKLSKNIFEDVNNLIVLTGEDGLVRYLSGSFTDYNAAVKEKINIVMQGYNGSFIVAYKNGKRVPLSSVGATKAAPENLSDPIKPESAVTKSLIKFKVQIGAFKNEVPADIRIKYNSIKGLETQLTPTGLTRYMSGSFSDFNQAVKLKNEMINSYGIPDAFIVAYFKDQIIPVQEAIELLK